MTQLAKYFTFSIALVFSWRCRCFAQSPGNIKLTTASEVAVPGHLLEPGSYWFRRAMAVDPSVYKIVGNDGRIIEFVEVIPPERRRRTDTEVGVTAPDAAGVRVLQAWYGPGDPDGYQLFYRKGDIQKLDQIAAMLSHSGYAPGQQ
jgi:hypothetical protein